MDKIQFETFEDYIALCSKVAFNVKGLKSRDLLNVINGTRIKSNSSYDLTKEYWENFCTETFKSNRIIQSLENKIINANNNNALLKKLYRQLKDCRDKINYTLNHSEQTTYLADGKTNLTWLHCGTHLNSIQNNLEVKNKELGFFIEPVITKEDLEENNIPKAFEGIFKKEYKGRISEFVDILRDERKGGKYNPIISKLINPNNEWIGKVSKLAYIFYDCLVMEGVIDKAGNIKTISKIFINKFPNLPKDFATKGKDPNSHEDVYKNNFIEKIKALKEPKMT